MVTRRKCLDGQRSRLTVSLVVVLLAAVIGCDTTDVAPAGSVTSGELPRDSSEVYLTDITQQSGIGFVHHAGGASQFYFPAVMSPGAAWLDFDCDGQLDIVFTDGWLPSELERQEAAQSSFGLACRLVRQKSPGRFVDATGEIGLAHRGYGMGVAVGDVNNDGFPDLYLTCVGADRLFLNQNGKSFVDVTEAAVIDNSRWGTSAAFLDFDRDGWLDLFVANYVDYDAARPCLAPNGTQDFCNPAMFPRTPAKLYRNASATAASELGDAGMPRPIAFQDVSVSSGIASKSGAGLGVTCCDFNGDGWIDIYVANDGHANFLWINQRDGTFRDEAALLGADTDSLGRGQGSMGLAVGDVNGDDRPDIFVTNLDGETNVLYLSQRDGGFRESAEAAGLGRPSFPFTGFGTAFVDLDHDGNPDLVVVNGRVRRAASAETNDPSRVASVLEFWRPYVETNHIYLNEGSGRFRMFHGRRDDFANAASIGRALAVGDFDNDGDLDLLVTNTAGRLQLFRNDATKRGHWLQVRAADPRYGNRDAYGAVVTVVGSHRSWTGYLNPGASYLSSNDPQLHFGLGEAGAVDRIEVVWPDGVREDFPGGPADTVRQLIYGQGTRR